MNGFLLDTNIISVLVHNREPELTRRIVELGDDVCTSIIVAAELRFGAERRASGRLAVQLDRVLGSLTVLPFESPADAFYGRLRTRLERAGTLIGPNDLLIAAHDLALGAALVTANMREFIRVDDLRVENWLGRG